MKLEDLIIIEINHVKINTSVYQKECMYYGKNYVDSHKGDFDCIEQLEYHQSILDCLIELRKRRNNHDIEECIEIVEFYRNLWNGIEWAIEDLKELKEKRDNNEE